VNQNVISVELAALLADVLGPGDWRSEAACRNMDPAIFFPEGPGTGAAKARAVCADCPVRQQCFDYAEEAPELDGIWGGYSATNRRRSADRKTTAAPSKFSQPTPGCVDCGVTVHPANRKRCPDCYRVERAKQHRMSHLRRPLTYNAARRAQAV
jgi:WhiB family redox-sensing transcriptional regulator